MSYAPACILDARIYLRNKTGLSLGALGIVGDPAHGNEGYHCGWDRLRNGYGRGDYSINESSRDGNPSDAAMGFDIGDFSQLRAMSVWIAGQCQANTPDTRDIREVIYSPDGRTVKRWDRLGRRTGGDDSHLFHTHISYFRDSENRDKTSLFRRYFTGGTVANADETERTAFNGDAWGAGILGMVPQVSIKTTAGVIKVDNKLKQAVDEMRAKIAALQTPVVDLSALVEALRPVIAQAVAEGVVDELARRLED